jgi:hypothetical protein
MCGKFCGRVCHQGEPRYSIYGLTSRVISIMTLTAGVFPRLGRSVIYDLGVCCFSGKSLYQALSDTLNFPNFSKLFHI